MSEYTEYIGFNVDPEFKKALKNYCRDRGISMSNFIKEVIGSKLIENNYLKKRGIEEND